MVWVSIDFLFLAQRRQREAYDKKYRKEKNTAVAEARSKVNTPTWTLSATRILLLNLRPSQLIKKTKRLEDTGYCLEGLTPMQSLLIPLMGSEILFIFTLLILRPNLPNLPAITTESKTACH